MPKPEKSEITTSNRVLDASLKLFNEQGLANVSALAVAKHLGISSGNLAYHFKGKTGIVTAIFERMESDTHQVVSEMIRPGQPFLPHDAALCHIAVFRTLWRYRFFFNALTQLLTHNATLRKRFARLQKNIVGAMQALFDSLIADGQMHRVESPCSTRLLAMSCWMIWLSWLRFEQIESPEREFPRNAAIYQGSVQSFVTIQPYFSVPFAEAMLDALASELREARS